MHCNVFVGPMETHRGVTLGTRDPRESMGTHGIPLQARGNPWRGGQKGNVGARGWCVPAAHGRACGWSPPRPDQDPGRPRAPTPLDGGSLQ